MSKGMKGRRPKPEKPGLVTLWVLVAFPVAAMSDIVGGAWLTAFNALMIFPLLARLLMGTMGAVTLFFSVLR